jgi:hypothetical protein
MPTKGTLTNPTFCWLTSPPKIPWPSTVALFNVAGARGASTVPAKKLFVLVKLVAWKKFMRMWPASVPLRFMLPEKFCTAPETLISTVAPGGAWMERAGVAHWAAVRLKTSRVGSLPTRVSVLFTTALVTTPWSGRPPQKVDLLISSPRSWPKVCPPVVTALPVAGARRIGDCCRVVPLAWNSMFPPVIVPP